MTESPGGTGKAPDLRASDTDRDRMAALLREAAGEGRLTLDEVGERLDAVYAAKTYTELAEVTADLPATGAPHPVAPDAPAGDRFGGTPGSTFGIGIMGAFQRAGAWTAPERFTGVAIMGGGQIDLRDARFAGRDLTIVAVAIMGGIEIIVPEDAEVQVTGVGIMGGFDPRATGPGAPGGPRITITGFAFWGGVETRRGRPRARDGESGHGELRRARHHGYGGHGGDRHHRDD